MLERHFDFVNIPRRLEALAWVKSFNRFVGPLSRFSGRLKKKGPASSHTTRSLDFFICLHEKRKSLPFTVLCVITVHSVRSLCSTRRLLFFSAWFSFSFFGGEFFFFSALFLDSWSSDVGEIPFNEKSASVAKLFKEKEKFLSIHKTFQIDNDKKVFFSSFHFLSLKEKKRKKFQERKNKFWDEIVKFFILFSSLRTGQSDGDARNELLLRCDCKLHNEQERDLSRAAQIERGY